MSRRVLVCDDEPQIAELIAAYFELAGCEVQTATDPRQCFRQACEGDFYLITIDLMMPGMDGTTTVGSITMVKPDVRILVITGLDESHPMVQTVRSEGKVADILHKPFTMDQLSTALARLGI